MFILNVLQLSMYATFRDKHIEEYRKNKNKIFIFLSHAIHKVPIYRNLYITFSFLFIFLGIFRFRMHTQSMACSNNHHDINRTDDTSSCAHTLNSKQRNKNFEIDNNSRLNFAFFCESFTIRFAHRETENVKLFNIFNFLSHFVCFIVIQF